MQKIQYNNNISENETNKHRDKTEVSPRDCPKDYIVVPSFHFATSTGSLALPAGLLPTSPAPGQAWHDNQYPCREIMAIWLFAELSQSQFKAQSEVDSDAAE